MGNLHDVADFVLRLQEFNDMQNQGETSHKTHIFVLIGLSPSIGGSQLKISPSPCALTDIQYRYVYSLRISASLITVGSMHSTLHPCSSNQCNTA